MSDADNIPAPPDAYVGRILNGPFSSALRQRVAELIRAFEAFDATGVPGIPYISAWQHQDNVIWYEFAGRQCLDRERG